MHCTIWKGGVGTTLWGAVGLNHLKEELSHLWRLDHLRGGWGADDCTSRSDTGT